MKLNLHSIVAIACLVSPLASIAQSPVLRAAFKNPAPAASVAVAGRTDALIPWSELGARAGVDYKGDGLAVKPDGEGARLHCAFQHLDGEATREGLWLTSTALHTVNDRFRVVATAAGRQPSMAGDEVTRLKTHIARTGTVTVEDNLVRFKRPGLVEEYTVNMDGVRQDFVVLERPEGTGELQLELEVAGARAEATDSGARLVLGNSGRKIAYSRLRVVDGKGRELPARIEVREPTLCVVVNDTDAIYPIRIDPTFSDANWISLGGIPGAYSFDAHVLAVAVDGSGNVYIGGNFDIVGDTFANCVAKWDGSRWSALGSGITGGTVFALAVSGSNLYAGGRFLSAAGIAITNIAKWDGSAWSAVGSGFSQGLNDQESVRALAVSGSTLYAGGNFTKAGGNPAANIAKWDGSSWSALGSGIGGNAAIVLALAVSGSDLYAAGGFTSAGGSPANNIAKWNGSSWSALGSGMGGGSPFTAVEALAVSGTSLYAGGLFTTAGGSPATNIAKWDGSSWSALSSGMNYLVYSLAASGSNVYAGGIFTTAGDNAAIRIAKWDGSTWSALGLGMNNTLSALAVSGTNLYAGGLFTTAGGIGADYVAKWDGSGWSALGSGLASRVLALAVSGSTLYAAGSEPLSLGSPVVLPYIAKWDGNSWSALGSGLGTSWLGLFSTIDNTPRALAVSENNLLYAGGAFTNVGGIAANYIAKWDGSNWSALGSGMNGTVFALAVSGSNVYAGGFFTTAGGSAANYVARWDGSSWSALGSGIGGNGASVVALAVSGSNLYAAGYFMTAGGNPAANIAKWDGSSWSALGSGMGNTVEALAVSGSSLYAGGYSGVAKWDGNNWSALGSGLNGYPVYALAVSGSDLYAGGGPFTSAGNFMNYIAKWDGSTWSALGSGMNGSVNALVLSGSHLYAGGDFSTAGGKVSGFVAKAVLDFSVLGLQLTIVRSGANVILSWPTNVAGFDATGYRLQSTTNLVSSAVWSTNSPAPVVIAGRNTVTNPITGGQHFYRLVH